MTEKPCSATVLMYHALESASNPCGLTGGGELVYVLPEEDFRRQMRLLNEMGIEVVLPGDDEPPEPRAARSSPHAGSTRVVLTFDDGHVSNHSAALPALSDLGFRGIFFVTTDWIGKEKYMSAEMIRDLASAGMIVGSHGRSHRFLTALSGDELREELAGSRKVLEEITGGAVDSLSAPGGRLDERVTDAALKAGYRWIYDSVPAVNRSFVPGRPVHRFAIMRSSSDAWFAKVVSGAPPLSAALRYRLLDFARKTLGDRLYEAVRSRVLGDTPRGSRP